MPARIVKKTKAVFNGLSAVEKLKAEIDLLTRCSGDTVYRLRYDTMHYDYISPSVKQLLGYEVEELHRINMRSLILETRLVNEGLRPLESYAALEASRKRGEVSKWQADYLMKTKQGKKIWVSDVSHPWFGDSGAIIGSIGSLRDITDRIKAEEKIRGELLHMGGLDPLTGLANRMFFWGKLEEEVRRARRTKAPLSLLLVSLDQFMKITQAYGEELGHSLLSDMGKLLHGALREIDLAARLGADEFGVILPETHSAGALIVGKRLREIMTRSRFFAGEQNKSAACSVSIGVANLSDQATDATALYKLADTRLYVSRHQGGGTIAADEMAGNLH